MDSDFYDEDLTWKGSFNPLKLINEIKKYPALYDPTQTLDRVEKMETWKQIAATIFRDWDQFSKAKRYDRVMQIQKKWRNLRDTYNREIRYQSEPSNPPKRTYRYFKEMSFLGKSEGLHLDSDGEITGPEPDIQEICDDPLTTTLNTTTTSLPKKSKRKRKLVAKPKKERKSIDSEIPASPEELPIFMSEDNEDFDKLFLVSFVPEMRQLPLNIKMWARAQIAKIMQEAVQCQIDNKTPEKRYEYDALSANI